MMVVMVVLEVMKVMMEVIKVMEVMVVMEMMKVMVVIEVVVVIVMVVVVQTLQQLHGALVWRAQALHETQIRSLPKPAVLVDVPALPLLWHVDSVPYPFGRERRRPLLLGRRRLRSPRPRAPQRRCPGGGSARQDPERRGPAGSRTSAGSAMRAPSPCSPGPALAAAAAAASARIRARLRHRAIITGARGDVIRTPAPPPPPGGVLENCGARAPRTGAHARRAPGASRAHAPRARLSRTQSSAPWTVLGPLRCTRAHRKTSAPRTRTRARHQPQPPWAHVGTHRPHPPPARFATRTPRPHSQPHPQTPPQRASRAGSSLPSPAPAAPRLSARTPRGPSSARSPLRPRPALPAEDADEMGGDRPHCKPAPLPHW
nr:serine/arginine repetitive matrix protein 3-like [Oryctolagus cuniculus]